MVEIVLSTTEAENPYAAKNLSTSPRLFLRLALDHPRSQREPQKALRYYCATATVHATTGPVVFECFVELDDVRMAHPSHDGLKLKGITSGLVTVCFACRLHNP